MARKKLPHSTYACARRHTPLQRFVVNIPCKTLRNYLVALGVAVRILLPLTQQQPVLLRRLYSPLALVTELLVCERQRVPHP
jgi:hypothetical protein